MIVRAAPFTFTILRHKDLSFSWFFSSYSQTLLHCRCVSDSASHAASPSTVLSSSIGSRMEPTVGHLPSTLSALNPSARLSPPPSTPLLLLLLLLPVVVVVVVAVLLLLLPLDPSVGLGPPGDDSRSATSTSPSSTHSGHSNAAAAAADLNPTKYSL